MKELIADLDITSIVKREEHILSFFEAPGEGVNSSPLTGDVTETCDVLRQIIPKVSGAPNAYLMRSMAERQISF